MTDKLTKIKACDDPGHVNHVKEINRLRANNAELREALREAVVAAKAAGMARIIYKEWEKLLNPPDEEP